MFEKTGPGFELAIIEIYNAMQEFDDLDMGDIPVMDCVQISHDSASALFDDMNERETKGEEIEYILEICEHGPEIAHKLLHEYYAKVRTERGCRA